MVTEGKWMAVEGDTLNPDRPWGIVRFMSKEECREIDGDDYEYPSRTEVIAEVCAGPTAEGDARLMSAVKELKDALEQYVALDNRRRAGIRPRAADWARCHQAASDALFKSLE